MNAAFNVNVNTFNGPMDLLLQLISKHEVDIFDIPIAIITEQYLIHVKSLEGLDMDELSGFLVLAATLLSIKARMLLPLPITLADEIESEDDPRADLVRQILEYRLYKEKAAELAESGQFGALAVYRGLDETVDWEHAAVNPPQRQITGIITPEKLHQMFLDVINRKERRVDKQRAGFGTLHIERYTITDRMLFITQKLKNSRTTFFELFDSSADKEEVVITFLALLELMKQQRVSARQENPFAVIELVNL
ncbi:MAG: segregation/condensation protein A [Defluviitaleaceae bacterium]|nr:segregation/condensation protein A [Defluviitaleaceae bacterium]